MATPAQVVQDFVDAFVIAWPTADAQALAQFFSENAVYQNGPLDPVRGRDAIQTTIANFMGLGGSVAVYMPHVLADATRVMTERVDHFLLEGRTLSLPVMGIFEVADGKIMAWRDYFDLASFTALMGSNTQD